VCEEIAHRPSDYPKSSEKGVHSISREDIKGVHSISREDILPDGSLKSLKSL